MLTWLLPCQTTDPQIRLQLESVYEAAESGPSFNLTPKVPLANGVHSWNPSGDSRGVPDFCLCSIFWARLHGFDDAGPGQPPADYTDWR